MIDTTICHIEKDGKWLMLLRNKKENDLNEGKWIGIGGKREPGESMDDCCRREVFEETGLTLRTVHCAGVAHFRSDTWEDEEIYIYTSDAFSGTMSEDCAEGTLSWIPKQEILDLNLWEGDRIFLKPLLAGADDIEITLNYRGNDLVSFKEEKSPVTVHTGLADFSEEAGRFFPGMMQEILHHRDVIRDGIVTAETDGGFAGVGYLANMAPCGLFCNFMTVSPNPYEIEAAEALLEALKAKYEVYRTAHKLYTEKLTVWCAKKQKNYRAFLNAHGFRAEKEMLFLEMPAKTLAKEHVPELPDGVRIFEIDLSDRKMLSDYIEATERGFGSADSRNEMLYCVQYCGAHVYAALFRGKPVAAVTTWPVGMEKGVTENVFCVPEFRRKGLATALLCHAADILSEEGIRTVRISVFKDNRVAVRLYKKLGYRHTDSSIFFSYCPGGLE